MFAGSLSNRSLWTPERIDTALWLDAADSSTITTVSGRVSEWRDKSGSDYHATQGLSGNRPTVNLTGLNGLPAIDFNGTTNFLSANDLSVIARGDDSPWSSAVVFSATVNTTFRTIIGFGSNLFIDYFHNVGLGDTNEVSVGRRTTTAPFVQKTISGNVVADSPLICLYTFTGTNGTIHENGALTANGDQDVESFGAYPDRFAIGALLRESPGSYLDALISEVVIVSGAMGEDDRQKTEGYLAHKWGLTANLPANHPYKNYPPRGL